MLKDFRAKDLVALVVIGSMVLFKMTGHNGTLDVVVAIIVGYYFAKREDQPLVVNKTIAAEILTERNHV